MSPITVLARSILEGIPEAVCVLDLNHEITYLNPAAERLTLWSLDQVIGRTCDEVFGDELRSVAASAPPQAGLQPDPTVTGREVSIVTGSGTDIAVIVSASWLGDAATPDGIMFVLSRVDACQDGLKSAAYLASFPELSPSAVLEVEPSGLVTYANPSAQRLFPGLVERGKNHPFLAGLEALLERLSPDGQEARVREIRVGDAWYQQSWSLISETGRARIYAIDVSEHVRMEQSLRDSEARFRTAFEDAAVAMFLTDVEGNVRGVNEVFCRLLGYTHVELDAMDLTMVTHPDDIDADRGCRERLLAGEAGAIRFGKRYVRKDGGVVRAEVSISLLRRVAGSPLHFVTIVLDLTAPSEAADLPVGERHLGNASEYSPIGMSLTAMDGSLREANRALCDLLGYSEQELLSNTRADVSHPDDAEMTRQQMAALVEAEPRLHRLEQRYVHRDGHVVWAAVSSVLLRDTEGRPLYFIDYIQDLTAQRGAEERLRLSLERYRGLYESLPGGVIVVDRTMAIVDANPVARETLGVQIAEVDGRNTLDPVWDAIHEDGTPFPVDTYPSSVTLRTGKSVRGVVMGLFSHSGETTRWILVNSEPLRDPQTGDVQVALVNFVDITERRLAEQKVAEQTRMLDTILTASPVGVALTRGRVLLWTNAALDRMLGHEPGELVGESSRVLFENEAEWDRVSQEVESGTVGSHTAETDGLILRGDDTKFYCHLVARLVVPEDPSQGCIMVLTDMTERRRAEEAHRLATVGQLAAGVAQDFGNLLAIMRGWAQWEQKHPSDGSEKLMDVVLEATARGTTLTADLLALARVRETLTEATWIESTVEAALTLTKVHLADAKVQVVRQYPPDGWPVAVDQAQMGRVFLNLLINAYQAMPEGGTLTVATRYTPSASGAGEVVITFTDTGIGIAPEHLPRVFDPFFTTKDGAGDEGVHGTGLGLSVCHGIVTAHDGTMSVRSEVGVGTAFEVHLPLVADAAAPTTRAEAMSQVPMPQDEDRRV